MNASIDVGRRLFARARQSHRMISLGWRLMTSRTGVRSIRFSSTALEDRRFKDAEADVEPDARP